MEKYEFRIYDDKFHIIGRGIAEDKESAELEKERMAEDYRSVGYEVRETDVVKIEIVTAYSQAVDMTFILREFRNDCERFSSEVIGVYSGMPDEEETRLSIGQLTVEF